MIKSSIQWLRLLVQLLFFVSLVFNVATGVMNIWSTLLIVVFFLTMVAGNFYCGWICPFGALQEWLGRLGSLIIKRKYRLPVTIQRFLKYTKYIIFGIILLNGIWGFAGSFSDISSFNGNFQLINITSATSLTAANILAIVYLLAYLFASIFVDRPFCNYFCPDSIKYNLTSFFRVASVKRDESKCVGCKKCNKACPMQINVAECGKLRNANCINCMQCISECPVKGALQYKI